MATGRPVSFTAFYPAPLDMWLSIKATPRDGSLFVYLHDVDDLKRAEQEVERLAAEQGALRRVATAVARQASPGELFGHVAREAAGLFGVPFGGVAKYVDVGLEVMGSWSDGSPRLHAGMIAPVLPGTEFDRLLEGAPVRSEQSDRTAAHGYAVSITVPVQLEGRIWGGLSVAGIDPVSLPVGSEQRLADVAELLATAVANTEARVQLALQASRDALTGLANHATFHRRVETEVSRAIRHGRPLALAIIDVDHFKHINDSRGHQVGDRVLLGVAEHLNDIVRDEDLLGRIGGDEFGLLLPECTAVEAHAAVERARKLVAAEPMHGRARVSISAGICDLTHAASAQDLLKLSDTALYWSKAHGRNVAWVYDPLIVDELSDDERQSLIQRAQALMGIRALARAIDAKDTSTREHSERVAAMSVSLAEELGWPPGRTALLHEAALIHDVGKIGTPDAVLLKPGRLTREEYEIVKGHAVLGAEIAEEVLIPEQVDWIRWHHERPDGRGYPDGLEGPRIPEGAAIIALADAWDVMVSFRPYSTPMTRDEALEECRRCAGTQFVARLVDALARVVEPGDGA
jgi:diguanylate cyclase (GGDEF)-like protein/putative nucleotidyltransferase with HDIG domain